jgi:ketosteroid isomerase-like protein
MRRTILTVLFALLTGLPAASGASNEEEVRKAEMAWSSAVKAMDFAALGKLMHDEMIYAHSTGVIETKDEYLGKLRSGTQKYTAIDYHQSTIRTFGDSAVFHAIVTMKGTSSGNPFDNKLMMIHTWVKHGAQWRLAAHQTTRLSE